MLTQDCFIFLYLTMFYNWVHAMLLILETLKTAYDTQLKSIYQVPVFPMTTIAVWRKQNIFITSGGIMSENMKFSYFASIILKVSTKVKRNRETVSLFLYLKISELKCFRLSHMVLEKYKPCYWHYVGNIFAWFTPSSSSYLGMSRTIKPRYCLIILYI